MPADSCTNNQTPASFKRDKQLTCLQQQARDDEAEPEVVDLRQGVQARQRVGKAEQADRAGHEKECAGYDGGDGKDIKGDCHP